MSDSNITEKTHLVSKQKRDSEDASVREELEKIEQIALNIQKDEKAILEMYARTCEEQEDSKTPFLLREVKVKDASNLDKLQLLKDMLVKYNKKLDWWMRKAKLFKALNLALTFLVVLINVVQVVIFQIPGISSQLQRSLATIIPCVSSLLVSLQQKLDWTAKSSKAKRSTVVYSKLIKHIEHRIQIMGVGVTIDDVIEMWNKALIKEIEEVPAILVPY